MSRVICFLIFLWQVQATAMGLLQALKEAEVHSPRLKSASLQVQAAREQIRVARAGYLPSLDLNAIASDGNPGAFSFLNVDGNISAADRIGTGGAAILKQTIWDFGRTSSAMDAAKAETEVAEKNAAVGVADVDLEVLRTYLQCSAMKSQMSDAEFTSRQAQIIAGETNKYVRSGQRSIVEKYLVDAQAKEAETLVAELKERAQQIEKRLALLLGHSGEMSCAAMKDVRTEIEGLKAGGQNPLIELSRAEGRLAQAKYSQAKSDQWPTLLALVEGGYFQDLNRKIGWNYAAGVGLSIPIFEGFSKTANVDLRKAEMDSKQALVDYSQEVVAETNSKYDEQIQALQVRASFLQKESQLANSAFNLAKKRYFSLQGTMVDLRESLRNLHRVNLAIDEAERDLLFAKGGAALANGARVQ